MSKIKLSKTFIKDRVKLALAEDLYPYGDITSNLLKKSEIIMDKETIDKARISVERMAAIGR